MAIESLLGLFERLEFLASGSGVPKGKLFRASGTVPRPAAHANFATIVDGIELDFGRSFSLFLGWWRGYEKIFFRLVISCGLVDRSTSG